MSRSLFLSQKIKGFCNIIFHAGILTAPHHFMYSIEYLFGQQELDGEVKYAVKWQNYRKKDMTFEPIENLGVNNHWAVMRYVRAADYEIFHQLENKLDGRILHYKKDRMEIKELVPKIQSIKIEQSHQNQQQILEQDVVIQPPKKARQKNTPIIKLEQQEPQLMEAENGKAVSGEGELQKEAQSKNKSRRRVTKKTIKQELDTSQLVSDPVPEREDCSEGQQCEEITSAKYIARLQQALEEMENKDQITDQKDPFEILAHLYLTERGQLVQEVAHGLKDQYEETKYVEPKFKEEKKKQKQKGRLTTIRSLQQQSLNMQDFINCVMETKELSLVDTLVDNQNLYGQIGFDKAVAITRHCFGIPIQDSSAQKVEIQIFFLFEYTTRSNGTQPLPNYASRQAAELYEKNLFLNYLKANQATLPGLFQQCF